MGYRNKKSKVQLRGGTIKKKRPAKAIVRAMALALLCLIFFSFCGCAASGGENMVYFFDEKYTSYPD
ncbi:MAG: hypothetical protein FWG38_10780, partial [Defluviitaleaceae bacterium]|nr:hypothetical protein [Defluviitaleaceae bacterium]